jgi:hypothetical protein
VSKWREGPSFYRRLLILLRESEDFKDGIFGVPYLAVQLGLVMGITMGF